MKINYLIYDKGGLNYIHQQEHGVGDAGGQMDQPELDSTLHCDNLPAIYWPHCTLYH